MGLDLVIFIAAILFGIFLYWRESNGNGAYRFVNKIVNSKELQMKPDSKKGFIYKQTFIPRLIFVVALFLVVAVAVQFLTPFQIFGSYNGVSAFASVIVGTLVGTYIANFVIKSTKIIEEKSDSLEDKFDDAVEKGKDFIEDLKTKDNDVSSSAVENKIEPEVEAPKPNKKSARERLKDKGLM